MITGARPKTIRAVLGTYDDTQIHGATMCITTSVNKLADMPSTVYWAGNLFGYKYHLTR